MSKRAVLYARVSGDDRQNSTSSLEGQLDLGRERVNQKGYRTIAELAEDEVSGARLDAPKLNQALEMARRGEFDVLVVRELDRLARSLAKQLIVEEELRRAGVQIEYVLGEYPDTLEGNLNKNVKAVIAEYERLKVSERMTRGRFRTVEQGGVLVHGNPPFGYDCILNTDTKRFELLINETQAAIVRLMYQWYIEERLSARSIALKLNDMGIPSPKGKKWYPSVAHKILTSETYAGTWHYGKRNNDGRNPAEYQIVVIVPAVIDRQTWEVAQQQRKTNSTNAFRNQKYNYLVGKRVTCGKCHKGMGVSGTRPDGRFGYYHCVAARSSWVTNSCDVHTHFRTDIIDGIVWEWVKMLFLDPEGIERSYARYQARLDDETAPLRQQLQLTTDLLGQEQAKLDKLLDLYLSGDMPKELLLERKTRLETAVSSLRTQWDTLTRQVEAKQVSQTDLETLQEFLASIGGGVVDVDAGNNFAAKRRIIEALDVQAVLAVKDGIQVVTVSCKIKEPTTYRLDKGVDIVSSTTRCGGYGCCPAAPPVGKMNQTQEGVAVRKARSLHGRLNDHNVDNVPVPKQQSRLDNETGTPQRGIGGR